MTGILNLLAGALGRIPSDDYFEYTTLLLPGNGTNGAQNNTFLDSGTANGGVGFTITRNGNTTQGTFSPFSQTGWGNYFNGSSYLQLASNSAFNMNTYCAFETWINYQSLGTDTLIAGRNGGYWLGYNYTGLGAANKFFFAISNGSSWQTVSSNTTPSVGIWYHVLGVKDNNTLRIYINGVQENTATFSGTPSTGATVFGIASNQGSEITTGYISNIRLVLGASSSIFPYNGLTTGSAITVPVSPLTNVSGTALLTCQSNRFIDNSTANSGSGFTITPNGSPSVVAFSPFNPSSSWSAATYGGSGYFDGNLDFLYNNNGTIPASLAQWYNTNYTIEAWVYPTAFTQGSNGGSTLYGEIANDGTGGEYWSFGPISTGAVRWYYYSGGTRTLTTTDTIPLNAWSHIAFVNNSSTLTIYINGVSKATAAIVGSPSDGTNVAGYWAAIGRGATNAYFNGYVNGLRAVKGTAVYTADFTPPTAPLTAITNTSLLLNFTNAGIYDATSKNDLETVGNAQISTTQSKWGGSSISFDGTGDWLLIPDQPPQRIGTGKFTIELWVYRNSSGTYGLVGKGTGTTGWLVSLNSSNQVVFTYASSTITSTGTVSATTWTHIAVVREGTSTNQTKIYINGTNDGTGTVSTDFNQTNSMYIGADRTGGSAANAYVQDVRITNDARYTANFTAPTAAFPTL